MRRRILSRRLWRTSWVLAPLLVIVLLELWVLFEAKGVHWAFDRDVTWLAQEGSQALAAVSPDPGGSPSAAEWASADSLVTLHLGTV